MMKEETESLASRTLVVHTGGIGDFVLFGPALQRLSERGPVELAGRPERLEPARAAGLAAAVHDLEAIGFESVLGEPGSLFRQFVATFSRVIVWMRDDGTIRRGIRSCGIDNVVAWPGLPPEDWSRHASAYYLERLGLPEPEATFRLNVPAVGEALDVVIHPGSGGAKKNWPLDRFMRVAQQLRDRGRTVTWSLGPAEENLPLPAEEPQLPQQSLVALAGQLAGARLYMGNDSGITHLAAAAGCPTVVVFGSTDPRVWAPLGPHVRVVRGDPWPEPEAVMEAIAAGGGL